MFENNIKIEDTKNSQIDWSEFSSTVVLEVYKHGKVYTSTAVVIGKRALLTAAHSVDSMDSASICIGPSYRKNSKKIKVKRSIIHPNYDPRKSFYENDLAIIILNQEVPTNMKQETIPSHLKLQTNDMLERIGFGGRDNLNKRTWTNPIYKSRTFSRKNLILEDEHSVIGDSGGPLFRHVDNVIQLVGIHSTLEGSSKTFVVNLAYYKNWIDSNLELHNT